MISVGEEKTESVESTHSSPKTCSPIGQLFQSKFAWLLIALLCTEVFLFVCKPLKFVHVQGTMLKDHDMVGCRVEQILSNDEKNAVIIGDSTADSLCVYPDIAKYNLPLNSYNRFYYLKAKVAEKTFSTIGLPTVIQNMSFGGCLMSDQLLICEKLLERGSPPKIAFLTIVPRPFIDTTVNDKISPVKCYFDNRYNSIEKIKDFERLFNYFLSKISNIFRTRSDYSTVLCSLACSTFERPLNSYTSNSENGLGKRNKVVIAGTEESIDPYLAANPEMVESEIEHYSNAYKFENEFFKQQFECFTEMLRLFKQHQITTVIIKLPLDKTNLDLLPKNADSILNNKIEDTASKFQAKIIDLQKDPRFNKNDFIDSVHMNASGSIKLWKFVAEELEKEPTLIKSIKNRLETI